MTETLNREQAAPVPTTGKAIWELVVADMQERDRIGQQRYGTRLQTFNGRHSLVDAYQEILDLAVYLRQRIEENRLDYARGRDEIARIIQAEILEGQSEPVRQVLERLYRSILSGITTHSNHRTWHCPGNRPDSTGKPCCEKAGRHDGSGGGEYKAEFVCPLQCSCHD